MIRDCKYLTVSNLQTPLFRCGVINAQQACINLAYVYCGGAIQNALEAIFL